MRILSLLPAIAERVPGAHLLVVGEGQEHENLSVLAERLGMGDRLHLVGSQENVASYLSAMDVFAFPSLHEGLGLAMIEAQANGLPVVASSACTRDVAITDSNRFVDLEDGCAWVEGLCGSSRADVYLNDRAVRFDLSREGDWLADLFICGVSC